jgi:hypothetical protein
MYDDIRRKNIADVLEEMEPYVVFNEQRVRKTETILDKIMSMFPSIVTTNEKKNSHAGVSNTTTGNGDDVCDNV